MGKETVPAVEMKKNSVHLTDDKASLALSYACMILVDDDLDITADKLVNILNAANVSVDGFWPGLWAKSLQNVSMSSMFGGGFGAGAAVTTAAGNDASGAAAEVVEEKPAESSEDSGSDDDMGFGLFD